MIFLSFNENKNSKSTDINIAAKSIILKEISDIPPSIATGTPITTQILNILLPTTFPIAKSYSPFLVAATEVTNSGSDVPRATIVKAIIFSLTPKLDAIPEALSTTKSLPKIIHAKPIIINNIDFGILYLIGSSSEILSLSLLAIVTK